MPFTSGKRKGSVSLQFANESIADSFYCDRGGREKIHMRRRNRLPLDSPLRVLTNHDGSPCDFGILRFPSFRADGSHKDAKWCRVSVESKVGDIIDLMVDSWGVPDPRCAHTCVRARAFASARLRTGQRPLTPTAIRVALLCCTLHAVRAIACSCYVLVTLWPIQVQRALSSA